MKKIVPIQFLAFLSLLTPGAGLGQVPRLTSGSTVYIEPMDGYETYLAAALSKKHVPLMVVADESKADFVIRSSVKQRAPSRPDVVVNNNVNVNSANNGAFGKGLDLGQHGTYGSTSASISVVDVHSSQVVFAYSVGKSRNTNQIQSAAEACAKHLKAFIEKPPK